MTGAHLRERAVEILERGGERPPERSVLGNLWSLAC